MAPIEPTPKPMLKSAQSRPSAHPAWDQGWWRGAARHVESPNQGPRPEGCPIELVVLHSISLPPGVFGGNEVQALFTNTLDCDAHPYFDQLRTLRVSAHFLIRRDGQVLQFVSCDRRAWHAGRSLWMQRNECNDWSIGIELEGLEGGLFEPAQYQVLTRLLRALRRRYPINQVVAHEHIAPGRKSDPGPGFDWAGLRASLRWSKRWFASVEQIDANAQIARQKPL